MADDVAPLDLASALGNYGVNLAEPQTHPTMLTNASAARSAAPWPLKQLEWESAKYLKARLALEAAVEADQGVELDAADFSALLVGLALGASSIAYAGRAPAIAFDASRHTLFGSGTSIDTAGLRLASPFGHVLGHVPAEHRTILSIAQKAIKRLRKSPTAPVAGKSYLKIPAGEVFTFGDGNANAPTFAAAPLVVLGVAAIAAVTVFATVTVSTKIYVDGEVAKSALLAGRFTEIAIDEMTKQIANGQEVHANPAIIAAMGAMGAPKAEKMSVWDYVVPGAIALGIGGAIGVGFSFFNRKKKDKAA